MIDVASYMKVTVIIKTSNADNRFHSKRQSNLSPLVEPRIINAKCLKLVNLNIILVTNGNAVYDINNTVFSCSFEFEQNN